MINSLVDVLNEDNLIGALIVAHQLGFNDIQETALQVITRQKLDSDKIFNGRSMSNDLWTLVSKAIHKKMAEKM